MERNGEAPASDLLERITEHLEAYAQSDATDAITRLRTQPEQLTPLAVRLQA